MRYASGSQLFTAHCKQSETLSDSANMYVSFFVVCHAFLTVLNEGTAELTAVSNSPYTCFFYGKLHTEDPPLESVDDAHTRAQICENITASGFFPWWHLARVDEDDVLRNRHLPNYANAFRQLYNSATNEYANPYKPQDFLVRTTTEFYRDYVFACPLKRKIDRAIVLFYVSKEYNVSPFDDLYMPGRFVFGNFAPQPPNVYTSVMLAEEPARAYTEASFDVELHYLRVRKHVHPVESDDIDPLCKLISGKANQHYRLCVVVTTSSNFKDQITYMRESVSQCQLKEISFRSEVAKKEAAEKSYSERMTLCYSAYKSPREEHSFLYISRGYMSNQVLVYRFDPADDKIYLENSSTNIGVIDELNSFEFVED